MAFIGLNHPTRFKRVGLNIVRLHVEISSWATWDYVRLIFYQKYCSRPMLPTKISKWPPTLSVLNDTCGLTLIPVTWAGACLTQHLQ